MSTRVAFVAPSFPPSDGGGQRYNHELATAFVRAGCHVRVVTPFSGPALHAYEVCKIAGIVQYKQIRIMSPIGLGRAIKSFSPDIIQTAGPDPNELTAAAVRPKRVPIVSVFQTDLNLAKVSSRVYTLIHLRELRWFDRVVCTNEIVARGLQARGVSAARMSIMPPGVSEVFVAEEKPAQRTREPLLLFVGVLDDAHAYKRLDILLQACKIVFQKQPAYSLVVVGGGPSLAKHRMQVQELDITARVRFAGRVSDHELREYYRRAQICVLPSPTIQEGFGLTLLEAMASGCFIVASSAIGAASLVERSGGLIVRPFDVDDLANGILRFIEDVDLRENRSARLYDVARGLSWSKIAQRWLTEIFEPLIAESRRIW